MPSSDPRVLTETCRAIIRISPKTVLDIGIGFGKWGMLTREYTDIWKFRFYREEWETFIVGIETHLKYDNPVWGVYNLILGGDAFEVVDDIKNLTYVGAVKPKDADKAVVPPDHYDLAIMIDVLEHFEKDRGQLFLDKVMEICDQFLVSYSNSVQKDVRDNKYEDHLSTWCDKDFERFDRKLVIGASDWAVYLLKKKRLRKVPTKKQPSKAASKKGKNKKVIKKTKA